jgi:ATP-dependent helicase/nuclease subunit A
MSEVALVRLPEDIRRDPDATQRRASDPAASVWVGASAGSGKTTILTSRVMRLLLAGVAPERILCLTFTRAAAAEMAIRVTRGLSYWATCEDDALREALDKLQGHAPEAGQLTEARRLFARLLSCPGGMRIRTIHAFCQEMLRRFPIEANLPPHFALIEEDNARALQEDVQADLLRAASSAPEKSLGRALYRLVRDLGERGFGDAMRGILAGRARFQNAIAHAGSLDALIAEMRAALELAPEDTEENLCRAAVDDRRLPKDILPAARHLTEGSKMFAVRGQAMLAWLELPSDTRPQAFDDYCDFFFTEKGEFYEKFADKELLKKYPDLDKTLRREAARLLSLRARIETARIADGSAAMLTLGEELLHRYETRKTAQALLDYDDLVIRAEELLRRPGIAPWVLFKLDGGLDHILVDEAQDTSRAQWNIVKALAEEFFAGRGAREERDRTLFVVGDEKQSIFSFQHADPAAFASMRDYFARRITEAEKPYLEVPLHVSFRSAPAILRAVDTVFTDPRARQGVSLEATEHHPHHGEKIGRVEVWPLIEPEKDKAAGEAWALPLDYEKERDPEAELAALIAARIANWRAKKERLPGKSRAIRPGDIMILLRRRGRFADLMVRALKERKVPVTGVDRMQLVKQLAVMDLLALVQFALLPEDDLTLATVLRGPLLGLSEEQLMVLAIGRKGTLWQSLATKAARDPVLKAARDYLARWLASADFLTPFSMLAHVLNEACPARKTSGRQALWARLGPDALDPIDELLNTAQEFGRMHAPSLQAFLHWLFASEAEIKRELEKDGGAKNEGQVRIMTVHAAKGLEAPIVFLPDAAGTPRAQDVPKFLWDEAKGVPLYVPRKPGAGLARRLWENARQKQMEEYRRLLYVALTRAADQLYIAGCKSTRGEGENASESWYALIENALRPLHEPFAVKDEEPAPVIAFADRELFVPGEATSLEKEIPAPAKLPLWARRKAPSEPAAPKTVAPSRIGLSAEDRSPEPPSAPPDQRYARGRIIHRLLESLPEMEDARREDAARRFLANPQHRLAKKEQAEIAKEVLDLLRDPKYAPLFASGSRAEVPLVGRVGKDEIAGQVDRLCVREDGVWIVDYKSNRPPPAHVKDVPIAYKRQLAAYRAVLRKIYPQKPIRCFLLWTYAPKLMEIPARFLDGS